MQEEVQGCTGCNGRRPCTGRDDQGCSGSSKRKKITSMFFLVGQEDVISEELEKYTYPKERMEIVHASEVIETAEPPVMAIRKKKDSSIVVGMNMVKNGEADAFCVSRKFRSHSCRWTGYRRQD